MSWLSRGIEKAQPFWFVAILRYRLRHGEFPNLIRPATFSEKTLYRILFDRRAVLTELADKHAVRSYVESRLGPQILPMRYYITTRPETIPFDQLPDRFVVKPTHGSGMVQIVTDKSALDRAALMEKCNGWLKLNFYDIRQEWAYKNIERRILVEEFIDDGSGAAPNDYKLFVFDGAVELIQVDVARFGDHRRRLYTPAWEKLDALLEYDDVSGDVPPPAHLAEMLAAAKTLGTGLDFIRADFYDTSEKLYFGELTTTPGTAVARFRPKEFDRYLGGRWKLSARRR